MVHGQARWNTSIPEQKTNLGSKGYFLRVPVKYAYLIQISESHSLDRWRLPLRQRGIELYAVEAVALYALFEHTQRECAENRVRLQGLLVAVVLGVADHQFHSCCGVITLPDCGVQFYVQSFGQSHGNTGVTITHCQKLKKKSVISKSVYI